MSKNNEDGIFDGSDDDSFKDDCGDERDDEDGMDPIGLHHSDSSHKDSSITELQTAMDNELMKKACDLRTVSSGQVNSTHAQNSQSTDAVDDDYDEVISLEPVDIDANLLENIMESIRAQHGEAGPASALLGLLNVAPPVEDLRELS
jgi:hypothetical protein